MRRSSKRKKILMIIPSIERGGGVERVVSELSKRFSTIFEIAILTFIQSTDEYSHEGVLFSLSEKQHYLRKYFNFLIRLWRIYQVIKKFSPDLILSFMELTNFYSILTKKIFRLKIPLVISTHCNPRIVYDTELRYFKILIRFLYPLKVVNKIITISKELKIILITDFQIPMNKITTIYNGIDLKRINELKKEKISKHAEIFEDNNKIKFLTIGRLEELKGHFNLILAFKKTIEQVPNSFLIIIGKGSLRSHLERQIKNLNLHRQVLLMGQINNPFKYLNKADIFILSSYYEGLPMVLLEALACELPVISTNCPTGPREILNEGKYGILVNIGDIEGLAEKMIQLAMNEELRNNMRMFSLKRAKFFDYNRIEKKWHDLFNSILK
ncbi:MAG: glycosyltransferase [Promethearchaeota archaeon]